MAHRTLLVLAACFLCGCSTVNLPLSSCIGQRDVLNSKSAPCLTSPEYYNARKKAKSSIEAENAEKARTVDPNHEKWLP